MLPCMSCWVHVPFPALPPCVCASIWIDLTVNCCSVRSILAKGGVLYVKLRAGQRSYKEDPMGWRSLLAQSVTHRSSEARAFKVSLPNRFPAGSSASPRAVIYFQHPALPHGYKSWSYVLCWRERKSGGFHRAWWVLAVGRQEPWACFLPVMCFRCRLWSSRVVRKEALGINCYYVCAVKPKCSFWECILICFFSQKPSQLSLLILRWFCSPIIFANRPWTWARYDAQTRTSVVYPCISNRWENPAVKWGTESSPSSSGDREYSKGSLVIQRRKTGLTLRCLLCVFLPLVLSVAVCPHCLRSSQHVFNKSWEPGQCPAAFRWSHCRRVRVFHTVFLCTKWFKGGSKIQLHYAWFY